MNSQQPTHSGMPQGGGYGGMLQQQAAMLQQQQQQQQHQQQQQQQYGRIVVQQGQQQQQVPVQQQQIMGQQLYNQAQAFYPQAYMNVPPQQPQVQHQQQPNLQTAMMQQQMLSAAQQQIQQRQQQRTPIAPMPTASQNQFYTPQQQFQHGMMGSAQQAPSQSLQQHRPQPTTPQMHYNLAPQPGIYQQQQLPQSQPQHVIQQTREPQRITTPQTPQMHRQPQPQVQQQQSVVFQQQRQQQQQQQQQQVMPGYYTDQAQPTSSTAATVVDYQQQFDHQQHQYHLQQLQQQQQLAAQQQMAQQQLQKQVKQQGLQTHKSPLKENENSVVHNEMIRKQRLESERQKEMERDKREKDRIQEELQKKEKQATVYAENVKNRLDQIPYPVSLAACHSTTKLTKLLPVPQEYLKNSPSLAVFDTSAAVAQLHSPIDGELIEYMSNLLLQSFDDVRAVKTKYSDMEQNIYDGEPLPPLIRAIHETNQYALHIQSEFDDMTLNLDPDLAMAIAEVAAQDVGDLLTLDDVNIDNLPSTSSAIPSHQASSSQHQMQHEPQHQPPPQRELLPTNSSDSEKQNDAFRRQMVSLGKTPKGSGPPKRKRDEVDDLVDSLTPYYGVSGGRRERRRRTDGGRGGSVSDDENTPVNTDVEDQQILHRPIDEPKFFTKSRKQKKHRQDADDVSDLVMSSSDRPPTPTEVINQREFEWNERQRERQDKIKKRQMHFEQQGFSHDAVAESESQMRVESFMEQVFDSLGGYNALVNARDSSILKDALIDRPLLEQFRFEIQKLKIWKKLHKIDVERLSRFVQILERNIRDVIDEEGFLMCKELLENDDVAMETARDLIHQRLIRAAEAASIALHIMTAHKIPKQVLVEDTIERATQLCKQLLSVVIYPAADSIVRHAKNAGRSKADDAAARRSRRRGDLFTSWVQVIYVRCVEMIECFAELVRFHHINEFVVVQLSTMATAPFFVDGIGEIQTMAIQLLSVVFHHDESLRAGIIQELLFSIHQIPPAKNVKNCYRLSNTESIHNFTVLLLQLIQSVVVMPRHKKNEEGEEEHATEEDDHVIEECFSSAKKYAATFLRGFLHKCTAKAEEDYRRKFEQFLHDLLLALNRPEWPAAELLLTVLGNLLVQSFKNTKLEISLRTASLDYLGTITARLRRDHIIAQREANSQFENVRFDMVVKGILYEEANDPTKLLDDIDTTSLSSMEKFQKLQQALVDYLIATKGNDASIEHCIAFYACEWYKGIIDDIGMARRRYVELTASMDPASRDFKKEDKRYKRSNERADVMKDFLIRLSDKKVIKRRINYIAKTGNYMIDSDALWTVKYLASKREFSQSFDIYLRHIIHGVSSENSVGIRTKAMRCLTQIIEADSEVLAMAEVHEAVNFRMMDPNVAVREATIELLGKYLVSRPDLFESYYNILKDRIKDTGVAVRKRIIRILRDYVDKAFDTAPQVPEILALIMRRVTDEEGVRKLTLDALTGIWFVPVANNDIRIINKKVDVLIETVSHCLKDNRADFVEAFLTTVLKKEDIDRSITRSAQQLVSALIEFVLTLDAKLANGAEGMNDSGGAELTSDQKVEREKKHQETLLASLTTLSIMSKVKPELLTLHTNVFLPYLSMNVQTSIEVQVLNLVINMLERTIPLIDHPSDTLFKTMDFKLCHIVNKMGMLLIQSAIACLGVVCKKWPRQKSGIADTFLRYVGILNEVKNSIPDVSTPIPNSRRPTLMRCLYSIGAMCRHFDFDIILSEDGEVQSPPPQQQQTPSKFKFDSKREIGVYADTVYTILIFFSRSIDDGVNKIAVGSLGQMCAEYTDFFQRRDLRNMYQSLLGSDDPKHLKRKIEVLSNLNLFLVAEEERMIKASEEYRKMREQGDIDDDIRNADTRSDTNSAVIQVFWKYVLSAYLHVDQEVRIASANVVYQTMRQGLVTPGDVLPTMIAMTTDPLSSIRVKIESLLRDIDQKYSGMLSSKATKGIRWSFEVQRRIFRKTNAPGTVLRGFRASEHCGPNALDPQGLPKHSNEAVAMLHSLYVCLRTNRQQRRSFINSVVRMISEECPFGDSLTLEEMLFIVDNLATFPYQMMDEALFLIHTCDSIISITGQNVLFSFKGMLVPKRPGELLDEEEEFMPENLYRRLPDDKTQIYELVKHSQACFLLLYLKTYIKKLYRLTDAKVSEYSPSEAAKIYEKPMIRQQISIFRPDLTLQEFRPEVIAQRNTVEGHITLCEQMAYFRTMFYSLDLHDEGDDDEGEDEAASGEHSSSGGGGPAAKKRKVTTADDDDGEGGATTDDNGE